MFKQNNPITRFSLAIVFLAVLGPLAQNGRCDFTLWGNQEITVNSTTPTGTLHDTSRAFLVSGANIFNKLLVHDHSTVNMSAGHVNSIYSYEYSTVNISGGDFITGEYPINDLYARQNSTVNISGGSMGSFLTYDSSVVNISGGSVTYLSANNSSYVDISDGTLNSLYANDSVTINIFGGSVSESFSACAYSTVNISGGALNDLYVQDTSTVIFYGQNFNLSPGLDLVGERVTGIGIMSGQWIDGTPWSVDIKLNGSSATILVTPEPATLLLLGLGAAMLARKKINLALTSQSENI